MRDFDNVLDETNSNLKKSFRLHLTTSAAVLLLRGVDQAIVADALGLSQSELQEALEAAEKQNQLSHGPRTVEVLK